MGNVALAVLVGLTSLAWIVGIWQVHAEDGTEIQYWALGAMLGPAAVYFGLSRSPAAAALVVVRWIGAVIAGFAAIVAFVSARRRTSRTASTDRAKPVAFVPHQTPSR